MYVNEETEATFFRSQGDLEQAATVAERMVRQGIHRGGKVEEIRVTVRIVGEVRLRPGEGRGELPE